ncbi:hypothetical protein BP5796_03806 [Coleophoma crateriformis]|uniref:Ataxin-10 homolog n=1 Tax=Coleophoma crateriformis TaxID=565419 RepID=A0A3D8SH29_9HELO|nr:hypothetical protein BP5796_03806 [Coleophoma crateriformis]
MEEVQEVLERPRAARPNDMTIEERNFNAALILLESVIQRKPGFGSKTRPEIKNIIAKTLELSLNRAIVRERLARNVDIWMRLEKIFSLAIPLLASRSTRESYSEAPAQNMVETPESATLILKNYESLVEDLNYLNTLLVISRNMLAIKQTAQEICHAVHFNNAIHRLIILCVTVTSKGYDGENVNEHDRGRLNEVSELYKKLLVTSLQHTHNWTMGNDRFKMSFWFDMLFDNDLHNDPIHELPQDDLRVDIVYKEVANWMFRHSERDRVAAGLLDKYSAEVELGCTPGPLPRREVPPNSPDSPVESEDEFEKDGEDARISTAPVWKPELEHDKYEQDRLYARVSHEIDIWWKRVRDANYEGWVVQMETVESAKQRAEDCKNTAMHRYIPRGHDADQYDHDEQYDEPAGDDTSIQANAEDRSDLDENGEEGEEEEEEEDDDSYVEGPLRGLLTEIPNILDTKQIEALHMTVKACIVDSMGSGLTAAGENLQKTRCKMFLALDCGKNLLREMLVFIAVWEQTDQQFIFQITAQIIESFHHNALLPYAWNSLRILKDIVSPAQTVLLRLINYMFRARKDSPIYDDPRDYSRDAKLIHFLYNYFRCRVVPDCIALMYAQAQIRTNAAHASDFPVDLWDMERAKDGLSQYLDFISVIADIPEMRHLLIDWDATYELVALLKALEQGVARKALVPSPGSGTSGDRSYSAEDPADNGHPRPTLPPLHDTPFKFPWAGIKIQILIILTSLVAPSNKNRQGPGNPTVQKQLLDHGGIMPLLNCCVYDGHNEYLKERATLCIKFVMEGCEEAQKFVRELVPIRQAQAQAQSQAATQPGQIQTQLPTRNKADVQDAQQARPAANGETPSSTEPVPEAGTRNAIIDQLAKMAADGKVAIAERTRNGMDEAEATAEVQRSLKLAEDMVKSLQNMDMDEETRAKIAEAVKKMDEKASSNSGGSSKMTFSSQNQVVTLSSDEDDSGIEGAQEDAGIH